MMASLLLSQGVPMIVSGDEVLRTQRGNNNAYCQDNAISWFDWRLVEKNAEMLRFVQALIAFRRRQPNVRRGSFLTGKATKPGQLPDVSWYAPDGKPVDWNARRAEPHERVRHQRPRRPGRPAGDDHAARRRRAAASSSCRRRPPASRGGCSSTRPPSRPDDIYPEADGPPPGKRADRCSNHHSLRCYVAE